MRNMMQRLKEHGAVREFPGPGYVRRCYMAIFPGHPGHIRWDWEDVEPLAWHQAPGHSLTLLQDQEEWDWGDFW